MLRNAKGILAIWHDVGPEDWEETLAWYDREHHAERVEVPGFLSARRYMAVDAEPRLFIRYETVDSAVLSSKVYLARVNNPTPWSRERQPTIINNTRTVCQVAARAGRAEGGYALTLRLAPRQGDRRAAKSVGWQKRSTSLLARCGIVGVELWTADRERTTLPSHEKELRAVPDNVADTVLVLHGTDEAPLREALRAELNPESLSEHWRDGSSGLYRLAFSLEANDYPTI
jgi:hypothetical protein